MSRWQLHHHLCWVSAHSLLHKIAGRTVPMHTMTLSLRPHIKASFRKALHNERCGSGRNKVLAYKYMQRHSHETLCVLSENVNPYWLATMWRALHWLVLEETGYLSLRNLSHPCVCVTIKYKVYTEIEILLCVWLWGLCGICKWAQTHMWKP